jgi:murein DD-endopeptidase MepM/ murein hydrolase activator NlpD
VVGTINLTDKDPREGSGYFGTPRTHGLHAGIDINAAPQTPVLVPADGRIVAVINRNVSNDPGVRRAGKKEGAGTVVVIDHGKGVTTHYFHLTFGSPAFTVGQDVKAGEVVATVGRTGNTPAGGDTHLHVEVRLNGQAVDPLLYFPSR